MIASSNRGKLIGRNLQSKCASFFVISLLVFLASSISAAAANHYVRAGATGNGSGLDWANACTDFTGPCAVSSLVRGDTYYITSGTYAGSRTWNRANSGTLPITIKRATVADHGTDTGWSASFDGQVIWGYGHTVSTGYWVFDGVTSTPTASPVDGAADSSRYGFYYSHGSNCSSNQTIVSIQATDVTFKNVAMDMCSSAYDYAKWCFEITDGADNTLISHAYCNSSIDFIQTNGYQNNAVYEYVYTSNNGGSGTNHGEAYQLVCNGCTIRYNYLADCGLNGGVTSCISGNVGASFPGCSNIPMCNTQIYGNVFNRVASGSGVIHAAGSTGMSGTRFYNNVVANLTVGNYFDECSGHTCPAGSGNNVVENNIIWNSNCSRGQFGLAGDVDNYNTFLSCSDSPPSEPNRQTGSYDPFVSSATGDFRLKSYTAGSCSSTATLCSGISLASPYNLDAFGTTRGADGVWDRGAFELSETQSGIAPPQHLVASVN